MKTDRPKHAKTSLRKDGRSRSRAATRLARRVHEKPPRKFCRYLGFTLAETLIAAALFTLAGAAVVVTSVSLMRSFRFSEDYGEAQSAVNRLADYLTTDFRSAQGVSFDGAPVRDTTSRTLALNSQLIITKPGYYSSATDELSYAHLDPIAARDGTRMGVTYGTSTAVAAPLTVTYTKVWEPLRGAEVIMRNGEVLVESAANLDLQFRALDDESPWIFLITATYTSAQSTQKSFRTSTISPQSRNELRVMLRNPRTDL